MPPAYTTVFQVARFSSDQLFACIGLIPLAIGAAIIYLKRRFKWEKPNWFMPIFMIGFGLLWTFTSAIAVESEHANAYAALTRGDYSIVEGIVTDFNPMPYDGHQMECFSVQDHRFCYSDYVITAGFSHSASHGGPIREGLPVRVGFVGNVIVRLDIPADKVLSTAQSAAIADATAKQWQQKQETDPFEQRIQTAAIITALVWVTWWNLQWKRVMRFWLKPPYQQWTQYLFRIFFAANLIGATIGLVDQLRLHPLTRENAGTTLATTAIMSAVVFTGSLASLWFGERRDLRRAEALALRAGFPQAPPPSPPVK